jgi:hypothetical protein
VNLILLVWVVVSFLWFYEPTPVLPDWIYGAESLVLVSAVVLAMWPRLKRIAEGGDHDSEAPLDINILVLKGAVFVLTALDIVVLWQLAESTGGVLSPYAPFLPAPAIFASFVTKKWETIAGLSLAVALAIAFSSLEVPEPLPDIAAYQGSAAVMVILAGVLSALQARVASTGQPITGAGSVAAEEDRQKPDDWDLDDDDLASSTEG